MPPARPRDRRPPARFVPFPALAAALIVPLVALAAACADVAAPATAPHPRRSDGEVLCAPNLPCMPPDKVCTGTDADCVCDAAGNCCVRYTFCVLPSGPGEAADSGPRRVRLVSARGPNAEGSFTTLRGERTLMLEAAATPLRFAPSVTWALGDAPASAVHPAAPSPPPPGPEAAADVPSQTTARWRLPHGSPLAARALAFQVVAELPATAGEPALRDSVVVKQGEVDVLRQEYVDFGIPVPDPSDVRTAADVAGLTRFSWPQLNQGDYTVAVLTPLLLAKLGEVERASGRSLVLTSVFRNPAHHRFHVTVSGGARVALLSQHQYGTAVDIATQRDRLVWGELRDAAKQAGACAEPLKISTVNHVHADWRPTAPRCPPGW